MRRLSCYREVTNDMNVADGEDVMAYDFDKIVDRSNTNSMSARGMVVSAIQRFRMHGIRRISTGGRYAMILQWRRTG